MLFRKLLRTIWRYKAQFISMMVMVAIGIGVFVGFNMQWRSLEKNTEDFLTQTNYADYRIYSEQGFSSEDIAAIEDIEGVTKASRVFQVNVDVKNKNSSLALFVTENDTVSTTYLCEGQAYDENKDGFWLSDKFAVKNDLKLGDMLTITYRNMEISGEILGLVKSSEFMICVADSNQLMPNYASFGFVYTTPTKIKNALGGTIFYPQIHLCSELSQQEMENAVKDALGYTVLVLGKKDHVSYAGAQSEIQEGKTMVSVLPILFLLIGVLTMITTMHRMTANEKTQIGTLKALGFKNRRIIRHYSAYGLFIGVVGAILGTALGYGICAMVVNPYSMEGTYFDMPTWDLVAPWWTWFILFGIILFLTFVSFLSVKKMLKGTAADALRPYVPKKVKPLAMEKSKIWNHMKFATKWNLRDVFRHKTRSVMTLFGVVGCMLLLVGGFGMRDTLSGMVDTLDRRVFTYETKVNFVETVSNEQAIEFASQYDGDYMASQSVQVNGGDPVTLEIYHISHDTIHFIGQKNEEVPLQNDGVYISIRVMNRGYRIGDVIPFSPYGSSETYEAKVAGILRSFQGENIVMTTEYARQIKIPFTISSVFTNRSSEEITSTDFVSGMQKKSAIMDSFLSLLDVMNAMVWIFVLAAVILGVVVLYNLGVMSYIERYRELATLKVVGFQNAQIGRILIGQNIWLTILGIVIGLPLGVGVLYLLVTTLASEYELKMVLGILTYSVSILLTFGVSLIVGFVVSHKNKKINMVEALKGSE